MKTFISILALVVVSIIGTGLYLKSIAAENGELIIGIGVSILGLVLIPLFVYNGYKGKDLTEYSFKNMQAPKEKNEERND